MPVQRIEQAIPEQGAVGESGHIVNECDAADLVFGAALAAQCRGKLAHLMGMKRLLKIEQLAGGRHTPGDFLRIDIRVGGGDDNVEQRVQGPQLRCGPCAIGSGRHAHVEERYCKGTTVAQRLFGAAHGRFGTRQKFSSKLS